MDQTRSPLVILGKNRDHFMAIVPRAVGHFEKEPAFQANPSPQDSTDPAPARRTSPTRGNLAYEPSLNQTKPTPTATPVNQPTTASRTFWEDTPEPTTQKSPYSRGPPLMETHSPYPTDFQSPTTRDLEKMTQNPGEPGAKVPGFFPCFRKMRFLSSY